MEGSSSESHSDNTVVATISGNPWDRGVVLNINNEVKRVL